MSAIFVNFVTFFMKSMLDFTDIYLNMQCLKFRVKMDKKDKSILVEAISPLLAFFLAFIFKTAPISPYR